MIRLNQGNGGREMNSLIEKIKEHLPGSNWIHTDNDAAILKTDIGFFGLTTDSFTIDPLFFPGGDIGKIAVCGTINDLAMMGVPASALTLGLVIEEGFPDEDLEKIMISIGFISKKTGIPIVTGDTKVMEKGKLDRIIINTSAVGITDKVLDIPLSVGDKVILSGSLGDHSVAVLSRRFGFQTSVVTCCKPLIEEIAAVKQFIKQAKDPTRGGLASALNDIALKNICSFIIDEEAIPVKKEVKSAVELLGIDLYSLACEGRFVCIVPDKYSDKVLSILKGFNPDASVIGEVIGPGSDGEAAGARAPEVILNTRFGKRLMPVPSGNIVPRIC